MAPLDDLIFMFFQEKRLGAKNLEVDPWISRIARVCKADKGGPESDLFNKWTTFLKARLVCSLPSQNLHFNRVEDVFIDKSSTSSETRVYGIFSNSWNSTAVCVYSMGDILNVFKNSNFKGFTDKIPDPRPGTCVADSKSIPYESLIFISRHPEMEQPIDPIGGKPIISSKQHYFKKIVVDRIVGKAGLISHVLYLATENGKIQKVAEINKSTFVISEIKVLSKPGPILSMFLDSQTKHLYINSAEELVRFPMPQCFRHTNTCENCVMARDPDCGWNSIRKVHIRFQQSISRISMIGGINEPVLGKETRQINISPDTKPPPMYLPCRKYSYHAEYSWKHKDQMLPCSSTRDDCLLLIERFSEPDYGLYECISRENGMEQVLASYLIQGTSKPSQ
uniref:Sema domain-containing protein n=1 Tax=Callorhinchus milii TaxID=7868 RepID=A0A4W3IBQ1_CALMI